MAAQITCDLCGEEYAISMITRLDNGDSLAIGEACQLTFHLTVARELAEGMPSQLFAAYADQLAALTSTLTGPAPTTEGTEDEHAADTPQTTDGAGAPPAGQPGSDRRAARGGSRRPG